MKLLTGTANISLSQKISQLGKIPIIHHLVSRFADGEIRVEIYEDVENSHVGLIQSTCPPVNENYMELFILLDALKQAKARKITMIIPYLGYSRQDRKTTPGSPISASCMARLCQEAGAHQALILDPHSQQTQKFFKIPVQPISAIESLAQEWKKTKSISSIVCISPDAGGLERAKTFSKTVGGSVACIHKERNQPNQVQAMELKGDVHNKNVILIDDMIDTAGTLCTAIDNLIQNGAKDIFVVAVHGLFSPPAIKRIEKSPVKEIWVTDSITLNKDAEECQKIKIFSVAGLLTQAIQNLE